MSFILVPFYNTLTHSPLLKIKNMKPILTRLFAGIFLLLATQSFGQTTMTTNFVVVQPMAAPDYPLGTHIVIELRVTNFTNIQAMQFPIGYNKDALRFDSLTNPVFSNWSAGNFISVPAQGKVGVSWDGFSNGANMPFSFPNGTAIFKLHFTAIGNATAPVNISPALAPPSIDIVGNGPVVLVYQNGGTPPLIIGSGNPPPPPLVGFKIITNSIHIPQGERGCVPITVNDFDNMISMQWVLHWDPAFLEYQCTRRYNLLGLSGGDIIPSPTTPASLVVNWSDPEGVGKSTPDGTRIFDVCFKAIGVQGSVSPSTIDGIGMPPSAGGAEAYNSALVDVWTNANHPNGPSGVASEANIILNPVSSVAPAYTVDTINVAPNAQGCISVKVKNFTAITNSEFALSYDPTELSYVSTSFGANPLNLVASNVIHQANPGYIKYLWSNANGATVANDAAIFSVCFNVLAPEGTVSDIAFTSTPCPSVTGIGTARAAGGVAMGFKAGWIRSMSTGPTLTPMHVNCNGASTGAIILQNAQSTIPTGYNWAPAGGMVQNPGGLAAGTYTVTVTYSGGTTATASTVITQPPPITQVTGVTTVSCFMGNNGTINLTASGGTAPYTYNWDIPSVVEDPTGLGVGIYRVTITDSRGCTAVSGNITVSGFSQINVPIPTVTNVSCAGLTNGSIVINPNGGAGNYTYLWSPGGLTTKDLTNIPAGSYSVIITDMNGCSRTFSGPNYTVAGAQPIAASLVSKTDVRCMNSATGTATISVTGGTGTMNYCWSTGPGPCASAIQNPTNLAPGTYTVIATDANGCTGTLTSVSIANAPAMLTVQGTTTPSNCFEQAAGTITAAGVGGWGNWTYAWNGPISPLPSTGNLNNLPGGSYTVTVTDANQCTTTQNFTVAGSAAITEAQAVQAVTCFGENNGGISLNLAGGNPPYQVNWSNTTLTGASIANLAPNSYQPTVTDAQGCIKIFPAVTVTGPGELMVSTNIVEANPNDGSINLEILGGGTPTFQYLWSNGATTQDLAGLSEGDVSVTITDANACVRSFTFNVPSGNVLNNTTITSIKNACSQDGCIFFSIPPTAAAQAPFTLKWGPAPAVTTNLTTPSICGLGAGLYTVTITASNGNSMVFTAIEIAQEDPASVNSNTTNPFSSIVQNGRIILTKAPGVVCDLQYQWAAPLNLTTSTVSDLAQGTYTVTITNPCSGCTRVESYTLTYSPPSIVLPVVGQPICANNPTGAIDISVQGGKLPYTFEWTGPNGFTATTEDISGLFPGDYTVISTDADNISSTGTYTLTAQSNLNLTNVNELSQYGLFQVSGANMCDGVAAAVFTAGTGATAIVWSNGVTGPNNMTLCGGAYSVTISDAAGCTAVWSDELTAPVAISATQTSASVSCNEDCNGSARVTPGGGVGPYSVRWSTGQFDPLVTATGFSQAVNLCGGDYIVTITDDNDVQFVYNVNVPEPPPIEIIFASTAPRNFNSCDGDILANITGAANPITYVWSGSFGHSGISERAEELCSGELIEFFITDANGCTAYATDTVPYPEDGCFRVSPVITPSQQDGNNDYIQVTCIETASKNTMEIYNRWGQLVFESDNYTNNENDREHNWNGLTKSGAVLAEGVYYYVLTFSYVDDLGQARNETRKGAINLLR